MIISIGIFSSVGTAPIPDNRVIPVSPMSHIFSKMPLTNAGSLVSIFSEYLWEKWEFFGIVRCHGVLGDSDRIQTVLQDTGKGGGTRRLAPGAGVALGETHPRFCQLVDVRSVCPGSCILIGRHRSYRLIVGKDIENIWLFAPNPIT